MRNARCEHKETTISQSLCHGFLCDGIPALSDTFFVDYCTWLHAARFCVLHGENCDGLVSRYFYSGHIGVGPIFARVIEGYPVASRTFFIRVCTPVIDDMDATMAFTDIGRRCERLRCNEQ